MTRWARSGSTQRHKKLPQDSTPWEELKVASDSHSNVEQRTECNRKAVDVSASCKRKNKKHKSGLLGVTDNKEEDFLQPSVVNVDDVACDVTEPPSLDYKHACVTKRNFKRNDTQLPLDVDEKIGMSDISASEDAVTRNDFSRSYDVDLCPHDDASGISKGGKKKKKKGRFHESSLKIEANEDVSKKRKRRDVGLNDSSGTLPSDMVKPELEEDDSASEMDATVSSKDQGTKVKGKKKFIEKLRKKREKSGILLLPQKVERKLYLMKKALRNKRLPSNNIKQIIRQARRKEELKFRKTLCVKTCFNCRKVGHVLSACPELKNDVEQGTGICFKCGSTEHTSYKCHIKTPDFPFAKCFICQGQGHLSRNCPKNDHGAYPKGGKCNLCGEIDHLKKDCPTLKKQGADEELTVDVISGVTSVDEEVIETKHSRTVMKKPKIVKF